MCSFDEVIEFLDESVKNGEIIRYAVEKSCEWGRYITIETESGWNPEPFWQEFEEAGGGSYCY